MKQASSKGHNLDRAKIAGGQDYEVSYEANKLNVKAGKVKDAVQNHGNSRKKVEQQLKGK